MLTESKRLNIAIILFVIINIYGLFWGSLYAILGTLMPYHETAIGATSSEVRDYNPRLMLLIGFIIRMEGVAQICICITNLFILNYSFRNKEKWSWIVFLITGLIFDVSMLIALYIVLGPLTMQFWYYCLITSLFIIAIGISYKEFFPKSKTAI
ncbi:MAG: hypothetical protein ACFFAN_03375 [Promethearchaeota archaeon]